ncbi:MULTISPECIES: hypothetical protein [Streptomyces]|uniref:Uncharacterized protein n=1 Tax=Streptomyces chilikensis TaxID=1194079 RepID=A0ABV3EYM6_9ACTN|nr:hypothetical protein [Streptomyces sp. MJP52]MDH6223379.1 hypothetical protein [Streptomyces sp. MJP52]
MTTTSVPTDRERRAAQAYLRLLNAVRAAFAEAGAGPAAVPPAVLAEADRALREAGLAGNEEAFLRRVGR